MADSFSNEPIMVDGLPRLDDRVFVSVDPRLIRVNIAGGLIVASLIGGGAAVLVGQVERRTPLIAISGAVVLLVLLLTLLRVAEVRRLGFQLREHDLSLRSGLITHRVESLPFNRIQHVNIHRGPVDRWVGLSTLHVSTAGPDISIPGLAHDDAERIKLLITERAAVVDDSAADAVTTADLATPPRSTMLPPPSLTNASAMPFQPAISPPDPPQSPR